MKKIKNLFFALSLGVVVGSSSLALATPHSVSAVLNPSSKPSDCSQRFLTFPTWYRDLVEVKETKPGLFECMIVSPDATKDGLSLFIWHIALNVLEIALQLVVYLAIGFILFGGFQFLNSNGNPETAAKSRQTIINAAIGIAISFAAIAAINLISGILIFNP